MTAVWEELGWPTALAREALAAVASPGSGPGASTLPPCGHIGTDPEPGQVIAAAAAWLGVEAEPVEVRHRDVVGLLRTAAPAVLSLAAADGDPRLMALVASTRRGRLQVRAPDGTQREIPAEDLRAALCSPAEQFCADDTEALLDAAGVPDRRRARARRALLERRVGDDRVGECWLVRRLDVSLLRQARACGLPRRLAVALSAHAAQYLLWLLSWAIIGSAALAGTPDTALLLTWALLLATLIPLRMVSARAQSRFSVEAGALLKRRLLTGGLRLDADAVRLEGVGHLFGRVVESEAVESLALTGGLLAVFATGELATAAVILTVGAGGVGHAALLIGWMAGLLLLSQRYLRRRRSWSAARLTMTHQLVEGITGHRTRMVQQSRAQWHRSEDEGLARYVELSRRMDRSSGFLVAGAGRGWMLVGLLGLAPSLLAGAEPTTTAVAVGGVLAAYLALERLAAGLVQLVGAAVAYKQITPLLAAAGPRAPGSARTADQPAPQPPGSPATTALLELRNLTFGHRGRSEPVLRGTNLNVRPGDRILLESGSGTGKSTLVALLAGRRSPDSGMVLLHGHEPAAVGDTQWRRRVVAVPQFHDNHVLAETFAFNLLMGRRWPPRSVDLHDAEAVCRDLGLGSLLDQMPAGIWQMIGDTGWRLSHGERGRLHIARALLQGAELTVLDESLAALDPETLLRILPSIQDRCPTLIVVAHP